MIDKFNESIFFPIKSFKMPSKNPVVNWALVIIFIFPAISLLSLLFTVWIYVNLFLILLCLAEICLLLFADIDLFEYLKTKMKDIFPNYNYSNEKIIIIDDNKTYEEDDDIAEYMEDDNEKQNYANFIVNPNKLFIDGTNVMRSYRQNFVMDGYLCILLLILIELNCKEIDWCVIFDANTEYFLQNNFAPDKKFFDLLIKNPDLDINVISGGSRADEYLLPLAENEDAYILSNDRFRDADEIYSDWGEKHPERLIIGSIINGQIVIPKLGIIKDLEFNAKNLYETLVSKYV